MDTFVVRGVVSSLSGGDEALAAGSGPGCNGPRTLKLPL